ncbi:MAG: ABC transporter permease [Acidobacteriaceae bacterium]|nr:ABC transporter permease [Acidobacteriaceae bacterium]MBV9498024.1 ABC transporter permease [Acidobacteriaceae bacterium]
MRPRVSPGSFAAAAPRTLALDHGGESHLTIAQLVTANYFEVLGVKSFLGRAFDATEGQSAGAAPVTVLSYSAWNRRFGSDREIIGRTIRLNGTVFTVIALRHRRALSLSYSPVDSPHVEYGMISCAPEGKDSTPEDQWPAVDNASIDDGYFPTMHIPSWKDVPLPSKTRRLSSGNYREPSAGESPLARSESDREESPI